MLAPLITNLMRERYDYKGDLGIMHHFRSRRLMKKRGCITTGIGTHTGVSYRREAAYGTQH